MLYKIEEQRAGDAEMLAGILAGLQEAEGNVEQSIYRLYNRAGQESGFGVWPVIGVLTDDGESLRVQINVWKERTNGTFVRKGIVITGTPPYTIKLRRLHRTFHTRERGYNFAAMHTAVTKFLAAVKAGMSTLDTEKKLDEQQLAKMEAIIKATGHEVERGPSEYALTVKLTGGHDLLVLATGAFGFHGTLTEENAASLLEVLDIISKIVGKK
jgi:hypothetical protein